MTNRLIVALHNRPESIEVTNQPLAIVDFPIERRMPVLAIESFPSFRKPPAKVLVTAITNEFKKVAITNQRLVDGEVLYEHLVLGLLVVKSKLLGVRWPGTALVKPTSRLRARVNGLTVSQPHQPALDFRHAFNTHD